MTRYEFFHDSSKSGLIPITRDFGVEVVGCLNPDKEEIKAFLSKSTGNKLDMRYMIASIDNTISAASYLRYLEWVNEIMFTFVTVPNQLYMLRYGFLPIVMPPAWWGDLFHKVFFREFLEAVGKDCPHYYMPAVCFTRDKFEHTHRDIWVSKMDLAERLHVGNIETLTVKKVFDACNLTQFQISVRL